MSELPPSVIELLRSFKPGWQDGKGLFPNEEKHSFLPPPQGSITGEPPPDLFIPEDSDINDDPQENTCQTLYPATMELVFSGLTLCNTDCIEIPQPGISSVYIKITSVTPAGTVTLSKAGPRTWGGSGGTVELLYYGALPDCASDDPISYTETINWGISCNRSNLSLSLLGSWGVPEQPSFNIGGPLFIGDGHLSGTFVNTITCLSGADIGDGSAGVSI